VRLELRRGLKLLADELDRLINAIRGLSMEAEKMQRNLEKLSKILKTVQDNKE